MYNETQSNCKAIPICSDRFNDFIKTVSPYSTIQWFTRSIWTKILNIHLCVIKL